MYIFSGLIFLLGYGYRSNSGSWKTERVAYRYNPKANRWDVAKRDLPVWPTRTFAVHPRYSKKPCI